MADITLEQILEFIKESESVDELSNLYDAADDRLTALGFWDLDEEDFDDPDEEDEEEEDDTGDREAAVGHDDDEDEADDDE